MELEDSQRWIAGFEGKYYININGEVSSILPDGSIKLKKTLKRNGYICVDLFDGVEYQRHRVDELMGIAFFGTKRVYFNNEDREDCRLGNLSTNPLGEGEVWFEGYEGSYSVDSSGDVWSYKRSKRIKIKRSQFQVRNAVYGAYRLFKNGWPRAVYRPVIPVSE